LPTAENKILYRNKRKRTGTGFIDWWQYTRKSLRNYCVKIYIEKTPH